MPTFYVYSGVREGFGWTPSEFLGSVFLAGKPSNGDLIYVGPDDSEALVVKALHQNSIIAMPRIDVTAIGALPIEYPRTPKIGDIAFVTDHKGSGWRVKAVSEVTNHPSGEKEYHCIVEMQEETLPDADRSNTVIVKQVHFFTEAGEFLESQPFTDEFLRENPLLRMKVLIGPNDQDWIIKQIKSDLWGIISVIVEPLDRDCRTELFKALEALRSDHNQTSDFIESLAKVILQQSYSNQSGYRLAELIKSLVDRM